MVVSGQCSVVVPIVALRFGLAQKSIRFTAVAKTAKGRSEQLNATQNEAYDRGYATDPLEKVLEMTLLRRKLTAPAMRANCGV